MTAPTLVVMTPRHSGEAGPPPPFPAAMAQEQTATLIAHWRAHGWPVARIGADRPAQGWPTPLTTLHDEIRRDQNGPIVLAGALSGTALMFAAEIARQFGLTVYVPEESLSALGVGMAETRAARAMNARILPIRDLFAEIRDAAVAVV
ncbi:hypothetical protein [Oleispirillum naphthae]|uniref:hypothetical protein n=1 Tax=Oleispirillum naphthae TaxID=2838853 RepID=UPI00308242E4